MFGIDSLNIDPQNKSILHAFLDSWDQHNGPVLFVGAGFSKFQAMRRSDVPPFSNFGSWAELASDLRNLLSSGVQDVVDLLPSDPLRLAQFFEVQFGRATLLDHIAKHVPSDDFIPGEAHRRLRELPWAAIITTNYDDLLERTFRVSGNHRRLVTDADLTLQRSIGDIDIIKMHGDLTMRDTIVITEDDYRDYESRRPGLSVKIRQLLIEHP